MAGPDKRFLEFVEFLFGFIDELNELGRAGAAVLVEGERDRQAMMRLGYKGRLLTKASLVPSLTHASLHGLSMVVILTDLDSEGRRLAGRYAELLTRNGVKTSFAERRRLARASHGVFLHIENLSRFASEVSRIAGISKDESLNTP